MIAQTAATGKPYIGKGCGKTHALRQSGKLSLDPRVRVGSWINLDVDAESRDKGIEANGRPMESEKGNT